MCTHAKLSHITLTLFYEFIYNSWWILNRVNALEVCSCFRLINTDLSLLFQTDSCQCLWCGLTGRFVLHIYNQMLQQHQRYSELMPDCPSAPLFCFRVSQGHRDTDQVAHDPWLFILRLEEHMQEWLGVCTHCDSFYICTTCCLYPIIYA